MIACFLRQYHLLVLRYWLRKSFPRLYDLYIKSERNNPNNYFEQPNCVLAVKHCDEKLLAIESDLRQMESKAWEDFKAKTAHLITVTDRWGWNTQLFDKFDEARGYCFLKEQGYSDIQFIPQEQNVRTPDLRGNRQDGSVLLEVKTIHESDDENDYLTRRGKYQDEERMAREVNHFMDDAMRLKLQKTIENAAKQLEYPSQNVRRRILLLFIRLDLKCATDKTCQDLEQFLSSFDVKGIEIQHVLKNDFFL